MLLPWPSQTTPQTLKITFKDGSELSCPYFDLEGTASYLSGIYPDVKDFKIIGYAGE